MKTYILRDPQSVQPQAAPFVAPPEPEGKRWVEPMVTANCGPALYVGLDVHTGSIA